MFSLPFLLDLFVFLNFGSRVLFFVFIVDSDLFCLVFFALQNSPLGFQIHQVFDVCLE
uniref:Uncharacterized protein n=1 Tax=Lotus japonicus TaxID=34305 RepID=I3SHL9_LOTJA|nr:unknown [Lotus japonicus]